MTLGQLREAVRSALDGYALDQGGTISVHAAPVDALEAPAYFLQWADPWLLPASYCQTFAALDVVAVAARLEPDAQYETLELLVTGAYDALSRAALTPTTTATPLPLEIGQVSYLTARLAVRQPVELPGGN